MPRGRPSYPPEFRAEAVRLYRSSGRSQRQVAADLGISNETLRNWVKQADLDEGRRHDGLTSSDREELGRLQRENRILREEREILKKAVAWFAEEAASTPRRRSGS